MSKQVGISVTVYHLDFFLSIPLSLPCLLRFLWHPPAHSLLDPLTRSHILSPSLPLCSPLSLYVSYFTSSPSLHSLAYVGMWLAGHLFSQCLTISSRMCLFTGCLLYFYFGGFELTVLRALRELPGGCLYWIVFLPFLGSDGNCRLAVGAVSARSSSLGLLSCIWCLSRPLLLSLSLSQYLYAFIFSIFFPSLSFFVIVFPSATPRSIFVLYHAFQSVLLPICLYLLSARAFCLTYPGVGRRAEGLRNLPGCICQPHKTRY